MSALKKAYKWLTGSANKAAKAQKKKREKTAPKPKGSSRGSAGAKKAQAKSNAKVKEKTKEKVRELTNSVGSQKSGKAKSGGTTGTQAHRSGAVSRNNGTNRPQTRSGAISSSTANQRRAGAQKASSNLKSGGMRVTDVFKKDNEKWKQNQTEKAKLTSQGKITATGGRTKTHTGTWGNPVGKSITDVASEVATRTRYNTGVISETAKASKKNQKKYEKETGHKLSKEEKREWLKDDLKSANKYISSREGKKEINKAVKEAKKSNPVKGGTYKAKDLTNEDYIRLQDAQRLGVKKGNKALGKDLARKIGSMKAYSTNKNTAARVTTGVMQGLSYGDVLNGTVGTLGKNEKKAIKEAKESGAYNLGYGAGMLGSFALSGTSGVGKAIAGGTSKAAAKGAAKATTKSAAKKFVQNRVGELAAETPLNITDAAKMAVDENGKVDKKKFAGYLGLNTALTGGAGAAIEGAGMKLTKRNANKYIELAAKQRKGKLTAEEGAQFEKLQTKLRKTASDIQSASSNRADNALQSVDNTVKRTREQRRYIQHDKGYIEAQKKLAEAKRTGKGVDHFKKKADEAYHDASIRYINDVEIRNKAVGEKANRVIKTDKANYYVPSKDEIGSSVDEKGRVTIDNSPYSRIHKKDRKKFIKQFAKDNFISTYDNKGNPKNLKPIKIKSDGKEVIITQHGIDDVLKKVRGKDNERAIVDSIFSLDKLIEHSKYRNSAQNKKGRVNPFSYYKATFMNNGEEYIATIHVKDVPGQSQYHYHTLGFEDIDIEKIASRDGSYTTNGDGNLIADEAISAKNVSDNDIKSKPQNVGYHAGDLGKSESHGQQAGSHRHTGGYGTGTYFVGDEKLIGKGTGYGDRPHETVNFDDYNLYRPKDVGQGRRVHDNLIKLNRDSYDVDRLIRTMNVTDEEIDAMKEFVGSATYSPENLKKLNDVAGTVLSKNGRENFEREVDDFISSRKPRSDEEYLEEAEQLAKESRAEMEDFGIEMSDSEYEKYVSDLLSNLKEQPEVPREQVYFNMLSDRLNRELDGDVGFGNKSFLEEITSSKEAIPQLAKDLGKSEQEIRSAIKKAARTISNYDGDAYKQDSMSTLIMKELGFEGVDVRGIKGLDNTEHGSVIYELKGSGKQRKAEIDAAKDKAKIQKIVNRGRNRATQKYVDEVTEKNRQHVNDRELTSRNADVIANSDDPKAGLSNNADSSKLKEGVTVDKKQAETSKANVHERLVSNAKEPSKYTKAEIKEIDETVDNISNMIANGDVSSARAESRKLAEKYGQVDDFEDLGRDKGMAQLYKDVRQIIRNTTFDFPGEYLNRDKLGTLKEFKEYIGATHTDSRALKIRKAYGGKSNTIAMEEWWPEMARDYPEIFPQNITSPEQRFRRVREVLESRDSDFDQIRHYSDEEIGEMYDDLAKDIYDEAAENASKFSSATEASTKKAEPKSKTQAELDSVKNEIEALKKQKQNAAEGINPEVKRLAEEKGISLESSRSTGSESYIKDIDNEIEALTKRQSELEKELGITKPGDTKDDLKNLDDMALGDIKKEIRSTEIHLNKAKDKYGPDAPRVKQLEEHLAEAKKKDSELEAELKRPIKKSEWTEQEKESKPVGIESLDNNKDAPGIKMTSEEKISKDLDKTRAELKEATEKYGKDSARAQEAQGRIDELEARLEDAKHEAETGQKTNNSSDPPREHDDGGFTYDEPRTRLGKAWQSFYRKTVDSFADIEKMAKKIGGEKGQRLLAQTNAVRNAKNIAANWITGGRTNWNRESVGKSLDSIFKGLNGKGKQAKRADFIDYCYHKHNVERVKNDAPITGMPREADESLQAIKEYEAKYGDEIKNFQDDVVKYCDDLLQYKVDAGIVSKAEADRLRKYQNYIPTFTRQDMKQMVEESSKTGIMVDRGLRKAVGGSEDGELIDLYEQIAQSTRSTMKHCEMNEMIRMVADIQGIKYSDLSRKVSPDDVLENSLFTEASNGKYYATYYDGEGAHTVDIPEEIYKGIGEWSGEEKADLIKYLSIGGTLNVPGRMFKNLITGWNPIFAARNGIRDFATALTYTKDLRGFAKAYPKAVKEVIMHKGPYYDAFIAAGGKFSSLTKSGGADGFLTTLENSKLSPLHYITEFNDAIETLPRMAEFISTIDKAGGPEGAGKAVIDRAMRNANDVTLNFGRSGIITRAFNSGAVPYLNPSVQGLDKLARVFTEAKQERNMRGLISLGMKMSTFAVAPAVFNEWMLRDNKDYQQLNTRDKDSNYFIAIGDGKFIKIPKARELVVVAEPAQYFFRHAQFGDSGGWKQMFQSAVDNIGVVNPLTDNIFTPIYRAVTNKTWFGGDIESAYEVENMLPQDRFDEGTSLLAIDLAQKQPAKALKLSPKKIDNLIDSYTGVIGDIFLPMNAKAAKGNPFVMKFVTDSVFSNKLSTEAWEKYDQAQQISNSKTIDPQKVAKAKQESQDIYNLYLGDTVTLGQAISDIQNDDKLTKAQKHDLVRELKKSQNEIYRAVGTKGVATLDGKEVDPLKAIYNLYSKQKNKKDKAVGIAMKYAADTYKEPYEDYKKSEEYTKMSGKDRAKQRVKYLNYVVGIRSTQGKIGEDKGDKFLNYKTAAVVGKMKNASDGMLDSFGIYKYQQENAETYKKKKYSLKHYIDTEKINLKSSRKLGFEYRSKMENWNVSMAQAHKKRDDGSYFIGDKKPEFQKGRMPAARYLVKKNAKQWSEKEIDNFAKKHDYTYKQEPYPEYDKVYKQAKKDYGDKFSDLECKALAQVITGAGDNDFGNTKMKNDTGIFDGIEDGDNRGGSGRRGYGRRGGRGGRGGGSSSGGTVPKTASGAIKGKVTDPFGKTTNGSKKSNLNDAYRKKYAKLIKDSRKKH